MGGIAAGVEGVLVDGGCVEELEVVGGVVDEVVVDGGCFEVLDVVGEGCGAEGFDNEQPAAVTAIIASVMAMRMGPCWTSTGL